MAVVIRRLPQSEAVEVSDRSLRLPKQLLGGVICAYIFEVLLEFL